VAQRDISDKWLNVREPISAGRGVPNVSDSDGTGKLREVKTTKDVSDEAQPLVYVKVGEIIAVAVNGNNARAFLSPMLLGVETEVCQVRRLRMVPHRHEAAFIVKFIFAEHNAMPQRSDLIP
jgi:hypothetical protein